MAKLATLPPEGDGAGLYRGWRLEFHENEKRLPWVATGPHKSVPKSDRNLILPGDVLRAASLDKLIARIDREEAKGTVQ